jgi:hypothetical protein
VISTGRMVPAVGTRESTTPILSRTKGRRYGAGHQKALQISTGPLPLVSANRLEEARCLPGLRPQRNAGYLLVSPFAPAWLGARTASIQPRGREVGDDLSGDEATEISAVTLLLTMEMISLGGSPGAYIEPNGVVAPTTGWRHAHSRA